MPSADPSVRSRFYKALAAYAVLALVAARTLDGALMWFVLVLLAGLAVKSWVHVRRVELD